MVQNGGQLTYLSNNISKIKRNIQCVPQKRLPFGAAHMSRASPANRADSILSTLMGSGVASVDIWRGEYSYNRVHRP